MMEENKELMVTQVEGELSPGQIKNQIQKIQQMLEEVMVEGLHYGLIPGCGPKPTLLKPGAEKLCMLFKLAPKYEIQQTEYPGDHREYRIVTSLYHIPTGNFVGSGVGTCSTKESKYRYRNAKRFCPECGGDSIIKGKEQYGGGWVCFKKTGGCGAKFDDNDERITGQVVGKVENEDPADQYNTCFKIGAKRSLNHAVTQATAASDIFAQDLEDLPKDQMPKVTPKPAIKNKKVPDGPRPEEPAKKKVTQADLLEKLDTKDLTDEEKDEFKEYVAYRKLTGLYVYRNLEKVLNDWWEYKESLPSEDDNPGEEDLPLGSELFGG